MSGEVTIISTGTANLASVIAGLERAGARARVTANAADVATAQRAVLPGVGAFGAAMGELERAGLVDAVRERVLAGKPTLTICLGLQLLCESSEESPGVKGLGVLPVGVKRFAGAMRVPQLGWNTVEPGAGCRLLQPGHAYFANSFHVAAAPAGWNVAWTDYGGRFVSAVEKGHVLACQFHPELSGEWGLALLRRWLTV